MMQYIIPAVGLIIVAVIEALAAKERKLTQKERQEAAETAEKEKKQSQEREAAKEQMMLLIVECTGAAIALGEATAHALQRGHTNGDTEKALEYAAAVKHKQKDFLTERGVSSLWE